MSAIFRQANRLGSEYFTYNGFTTISSRVIDRILPKQAIIGNNNSSIEDTKPKHKRLTKKEPPTHAPTSPDDPEINQTILPPPDIPSNREDLKWKSKAGAKCSQVLESHEERSLTTSNKAFTPPTPSQRYYLPPNQNVKTDSTTGLPVLTDERK
ncbi:hypothetical protein BTUL_0076g00520 [Botrytis tulipae]|uniref:Uncharacterized protein n=1 Tax=Botrytis tulipae TaxID=87230 RepID=A0A4Z1EQX2_9HELO|nr:hypothetical protein BTUL_0076g00520 [Botrytis tulipae]